MNKVSRFIAIVAVTVLIAVIATACQSVSGQTHLQPTTDVPEATATLATLANSRSVLQMARLALWLRRRAMVSPRTPEFDIVWQGFQGSWKVNNDGTFHGRNFNDKLETVATVQTDAAGQLETTFTVPEGFGFIHDVLVMKGWRCPKQSRLRGQNAGISLTHPAGRWEHL